MSENEEERAARIDEALARSQQEEREESQADIARQHETDARIAEALARETPPT